MNFPNQCNAANVTALDSLRPNVSQNSPDVPGVLPFMKPDSERNSSQSLRWSIWSGNKSQPLPIATQHITRIAQPLPAFQLAFLDAKCQRNIPPLFGQKTCILSRSLPRNSFQRVIKTSKPKSVQSEPYDLVAPIFQYGETSNFLTRSNNPPDDAYHNAVALKWTLHNREGCFSCFPERSNVQSVNVKLLTYWVVGERCTVANVWPPAGPSPEKAAVENLACPPSPVKVLGEDARQVGKVYGRPVNVPKMLRSSAARL